MAIEKLAKKVPAVQLTYSFPAKFGSKSAETLELFCSFSARRNDEPVQNLDAKLTVNVMTIRKGGQANIEKVLSRLFTTDKFGSAIETSMFQIGPFGSGVEYRGVKVWTKYKGSKKVSDLHTDCILEVPF